MYTNSVLIFNIIVSHRESILRIDETIISMSVRNALLKDAPAITALLDALDYLGSEAFIEDKLKRIFANPYVHILVYEDEGKVLAFIVLEFLLQIGLKGDIARIGYFAVDEKARSKGIGHIMETYCTQLAQEKGCDRIEVRCHERRKDAHRFYQRQGYIESPKYFIKKLNV